MTSTATKARLQSSFGVILFTLSVIFFVGASPLPAFAHDELVLSDPGADETVANLPAAITLTFSAELLNEGSSTVIEVTDESGTSLIAGPPSVEGMTVTQPIEGDASGVISVVWRVVSSDGHPISGDYGFTVTPAPEPAPATNTAKPSEVAPEAPAEPSAAATGSTATDQAPEPTATSQPQNSASSIAPWIMIGLLVLLAIAATVIVVLARRRPTRTSETNSENENDDTARDR